jgi:putative phosphoribosyl transferase
MDASKASAREGVRVRIPLRAPPTRLVTSGWSTRRRGGVEGYQPAVSGAHNGDMAPAFADRRDAGRRVAELVADLAVGDTAGARDGTDLVVVGLPRGGVPVAAEVAEALRAPLDVLVVGKVGVPGHEELALGAVADDGQLVVNPAVIAAVGLTDDEVRQLAHRQMSFLAQRAEQLRGGRPAEPLAHRTVVIIDDGMATGATMRVAVEVARRRSARSVVVAVPVAAEEAAATVAHEVDRFECVLTPPGFRAVGPWYADFTQIGDDEVRRLLQTSAVHGADDA